MKIAVATRARCAIALRRQAVQTNRVAAQWRSFSTAPSEDDSPSSPPSSPREPLPPIGAWEYFKRMVERRSTFDKYKEQGLFSPDMSSLKNWLTFGVTQLPLTTVLDVPEFLDGAKIAVASVLQATSSEDFTRYAVAGEKGEELPESENAQLLSEWCTPRCFANMEENVRHSWERKRMFEIESVDVERVVLTNARYDRVTEEELAEDEKLAQQVMMQRRWSDDATIERMQLNVGLITTERTRQTFYDQNKVRVVDSKWYYQAALISHVTSQDEIDWRVAAVMAERGLGETVVSESVLNEQEPSQSEDKSEES